MYLVGLYEKYVSIAQGVTGKNAMGWFSEDPCNTQQVIFCVLYGICEGFHWGILGLGWRCMVYVEDIGWGALDAGKCCIVWWRYMREIGGNIPVLQERWHLEVFRISSCLLWIGLASHPYSINVLVTPESNCWILFSPTIWKRQSTRRDKDHFPGSHSRPRLSYVHRLCHDREQCHC